MNDEPAGVLQEALIREGVALATMIAVVWFFGPGRQWLAGLRHRLAGLWQAAGDQTEGEVAQFNREVSRWDHEQAAEPDSGTAGGGPCGCG